MGSDLCLERKAELFEQLLETMPHNLVWVFSPDWDELVFLSSGYEELWGRSRDTLEAHPRDFLNGIHPDERETVMEAMERVSAGETADIEFRVISDEGSTRWIRAHGEPIRDDAGEIVRVAGFVRDITARKESERRRQRQKERLEKFAGVVSHDLRNPLHVAKGRLQLGMEEAESETEHLEVVDRSLDRMEALIDDLLTFAREGAPVEDVQVVPLAMMADESWESVETDAATLVTKTDAMIQADPARLRRLLENLFRNSVEHGAASTRSRTDDSPDPDGQGVTVTVGDRDGGFYVEDDGPGIPPDQRDDVFEIGYSTAEDGAGLGLDIVQGIADAHDWDITLTESRSGGVRFEFDGVTTAAVDG